MRFGLVWFGLVGLGFMASQPLQVIECQILFAHIYQIDFAQSVGAVEYTDCTSAEG